MLTLLNFFYTLDILRGEMEVGTILFMVHLLACQAIGNNSFKSILGLLENCRSLVLIKHGAYLGNTILRN